MIHYLTIYIINEYFIDDGHILPQGAGLVLCTLAMHRNEQNYTNPLKFDPDRWDPDEVAKRKPYSYLPFSGGTRTCPGIHKTVLNV